MENPPLEDDELWLMRQAVGRAGFTPHSESGKEACVRLEGRGLLRKSDGCPVWWVTDEGRARVDAEMKRRGLA